MYAETVCDALPDADGVDGAVPESVRSARAVVLVPTRYGRCGRCDTLIGTHGADGAVPEWGRSVRTAVLVPTRFGRCGRSGTRLGAVGAECGAGA